jgi:phenylalanyl-tRNA synthetase beta chain
MKVSIKWLQTYFNEPLPPAEKIVDAFTFHSFEVEEANGDLIDVKVLPNRAADCLSHRGLAKELSAILDLPLTADPLRAPLPSFSKTNRLSIWIEDPKKCSRYMGGLVTGVKVGPSPRWLVEALEAVGQRSINNVVDATNYVMVNIGQPLHAFDAAKLTAKDGAYMLGVRGAKEGEKITTLSNEELALFLGALLITDANADQAIGIAGIKGGKAAQVTENTTDLIVESACFDRIQVRKTAQRLKLFTDASLRFQNGLSPELCAYGMRDVLALITQIAGGEVKGVVDEYPMRATARTSVEVSVIRINHLLGSAFSSEEVAGVFRRLDFLTKINGDSFTITPSFERTDIVIPEDLVEEAGRLLGYEKIVAVELPAAAVAPDQARYRGVERMKDQMVEQGYIEVSTQSFTKKGDVYLANPLDKAKPALRASLKQNLDEALAKAAYNAPLVLPPHQKPKLFEVGTVFPKEGEYMELRMTERVAAWGDAADITDNLTVAKLEDYGKEYSPKRSVLGAYKPISVYPFIVRDIAMYLPKGFAEDQIRMVFDPIVSSSAQGLSAKINFLDRFEKEGTISYAFRLVFESMHRTLTDEEINTVMKSISVALKKAGFEVR